MASSKANKLTYIERFEVIALVYIDTICDSCHMQLIKIQLNFLDQICLLREATVLLGLTGYPET